MNKVILMGRLTREPDIRHAKKKNGDDMVIARYTLAVDRRIRRDEADGQQDRGFSINHSIWTRRRIRREISA